MIGGPNDVVVEGNIVRSATNGAAREAAKPAAAPPPQNEPAGELPPAPFPRPAAPAAVANVMKRAFSLRSEPPLATPAEQPPVRQEEAAVAEPSVKPEPPRRAPEPANRRQYGHSADVAAPADRGARAQTRERARSPRRRPSNRPRPPKPRPSRRRDARRRRSPPSRLRRGPRSLADCAAAPAPAARRGRSTQPADASGRAAAEADRSAAARAGRSGPGCNRCGRGRAGRQAGSAQGRSVLRSRIARGGNGAPARA